MRIVSDLPVETVTIEQSRDTAAMTLDEILICFAANISFVADDDRVLMSFEEAPLLGFARSFMSALDEIRRGERESGFTDFYGTFKIRLRQETASTTTIEEEWTGCKFSVDRTELTEACRLWGREVFRLVTARVPALRANPHAIGIESQLLHFAEDVERERR